VNPVRSSHRALNPVFAVENWAFIPAAETAGHPASNGVKYIPLVGGDGFEP